MTNNQINLNPNPVEAAEQALRDRRLGVHASSDDLLEVIANLLIEHKKAIGQ